MARGEIKRFTPINPKKYIGNVNNITSRSSWELKIMVKLDLSPNVIAWCSEEVVIPYYSPVDNRMHRYFTDFLVVTADKKVTLIEIKPYAQTIPPEAKKGKNKKRLVEEICTYTVNQAKWAAAEAYCKQKGWSFRVITEKDIPQFIGQK